MSNVEKERQAFEAWFGSLHLSPEWSLERLEHDFGTMRKGDYISAECRYAFSAWLARAQSAPQWKLLDNESPDMHQHCLVAALNIDDDYYHIVATYNGEGRFLAIGGKRVGSPVAWMPLPAPPESP